MCYPCYEAVPAHSEGYVVFGIILVTYGLR